MREIKFRILMGRLLPVVAAAFASLLAATAQAGVAGISGPTFSLVAKPAYVTQPDGASIYSWGYGCNGNPSGFKPDASKMPGANCPDMQIPGPTLIVNQGDIVRVTLTNNLPGSAGNTSILFPGFKVNTSGGVAGVLTQEAPVGGSVTYTFTADTPGTRSYYSGTQGDLQIEMGLYGAIIVLPNTFVNTTGICTPVNGGGTLPSGQTDYRLAVAAYDHAQACYDREYLFQFSEIDPKIHSAAEAVANCVAGSGATCASNMNSVETEPYQPVYFMINGRSMPDNMDPIYATQYPRQPYNGNPHMHPGELTLLRIIGHGRWQHPFHEHGNHVRVLARDGNMLLVQNQPAKLAGPLLFTTTTTPGLAMDGIFQWTGKGLNWDVYAHGYPGDTSVCYPDANGYHTLASNGYNGNPNNGVNANDANYYEWCADHNKALESKPFGNVGSGGPMTLPDPSIVVNGPWYGGSPYLGPDAMIRAVGSTPIPPSGTVANSPTDEAGFAYMWHSHNEREITTNNIFPGGMLMMMLVDPPVFVIDESK